MRSAKFEQFKAAVARGGQMTIAQVRQRFGVSKDTALRWRKLVADRTSRASSTSPCTLTAVGLPGNENTR